MAKKTKQPKRTSVPSRQTLRSVRQFMIVSSSIAAILVAGCGVYFSVHAPLFLLQVVEVADLPEQAPIDSQALVNLAAVSVGHVSLFDLDLKAVESRILAHPWIREVRLQKRFPQTLS